MFEPPRWDILLATMPYIVVDVMHAKQYKIVLI